jgi:hypothetical protein
MSFQTQIEDYIGTPVLADTTFMTDSLTTGARILVDVLASKGSDKLDLYATDKTDAGSGVDVTAGKPISAHKSYRGAKRILVEMRASALDADSIHYAISTDPSWHIEKTKAYVLPSGGTVRWVAYPSVLFSASTITNFPPEGYPAVVLYASVQYQIRNISDLLRTTLSSIAFTPPTNVTPPAAPSFTYTDAVGGIVTLSNVNVSKILTFIPPAFGGSYTTMDTALGNQDIELASGYGTKINLQLNQYSTDLQNQLSDFNKQAKQYDNDLQKAISQAQIDAQRASQQAQLTQDVNIQNEIQTTQTAIQEYQAKLGKYASDIQDYSAQVGEEVSRIQVLTAKIVAELTGLLENLKNLKIEYQEVLNTL